MTLIHNSPQSSKLTTRHILFFSLVLALNLCGCTKNKGTDQATHTSIQTPTYTADVQNKQMTELGRMIFFDTNLSNSGKQSCASCHDPAHAYAPANDLAVQLGGNHMDQQGARAVPSLRYVLNKTPAWNLPFVNNLGERIREGVESASGGFGWDGRFTSLHEQAGFPLMAQNEMANKSVQEVSKKLSAATYASQFRQLFGSAIFDFPEKSYQNALLAIEKFELEDASFHPYSSKFDAYLNGKAQLNKSEAHGLMLFNDPEKGNCARCHLDANGADGSHPLFTNYQYEALGVPRNSSIRANTDSNYFDLGVCGPARTKLQDHAELCGQFKTPSLRNVASRGAFFHNGYFHTLKSTLEFYVQRDTNPERWYPHTKNTLSKFDDLPKDKRINVNVTDLPLNNKRGQQPIWNKGDIDDVIAFLKTLTDQDVVNR